MASLPDAISFYENELTQAKLETSLRGNLETSSKMMPGIVENRFSQLQEQEAILEYLNVQLRKKRSDVFRRYLENYNKELSSREVDKYVDGDDEVVHWQILINEFSLVRNKFLGLMKALDSKQFQINNITKLRCAGLEDAVLA